MKAKKIKRETWRTPDVAQGAHRRAVALAAAISGCAQGSGELDIAVNPVAMEDLARVREELMLPSEEALIFQLAVQGLDLSKKISRNYPGRIALIRTTDVEIGLGEEKDAL